MKINLPWTAIYAVFLASFHCEVQSIDLESGFKAPPPTARPWVNWFWMDGNITRSGLTADLEAMRNVGIQGVLLMDITQEIPPGPVAFNSPEWRDLFNHTVKEAARLGLEVSMNNDPGWTGSGGPWIRPEYAMQRLVWSLTNLTGPGVITAPLPRLPSYQGYSGRVATLAFPTLVGDGANLPGAKPTITDSASSQLNAESLMDGNPSTFASVRPSKKGSGFFIQAEFNQPLAADRAELLLDNMPLTIRGQLQVSTDGQKFTTAREFYTANSALSLVFPRQTGRVYRFVFTELSPVPSELRVAELQLCPVFRVDSITAKSGMSRGAQKVPVQTNVPPYAIIPPDGVIDLTSNTDDRGNLNWTVPPGQWTVLRFGHIPNGRRNPAARPGGIGLECDKLSREAVTLHFNAYLAKLIDGVGADAGRTFTMTHGDSWECGFQNWTPRFRQDFLERRGYDPLPYLPAFTGRFVGNPDVTERFLWDVRRTIADLFADNYAGHLAALAHARGMQLSLEAYGNGPFDDLQYASKADVPMSEFWNETDEDIKFHSSRCMASAAHTFGKTIVAAEAFSAWPTHSGWREYPGALKILADRAFCEGVNRMVFSQYAHQPWLDKAPGMTDGMWGLRYERTATWWNYSKPWHDYLARCQFMLSQGVSVADLCYLMDEGAYTEAPLREDLQPPVPQGYDFDLATTEVVLSRMSIRDGRFELPNGVSYRVLVLPPSQSFTPRLVEKIGELVLAGGTIVGPRPIRSPSLAGYPDSELRVKQLANTIWGDCDGRRVTRHVYGKGLVVWGENLGKLLVGLGSLPDFIPPKGSKPPLRTIHRRVEDTDIFFVANPDTNSISAECAFRVTGKQPEIWRPDTGEISISAIWRANAAGLTVMPLQFGPAGSTIVVFRRSDAEHRAITEVNRNETPTYEVAGTILPSGKVQVQLTVDGSYELKRAVGPPVRLQHSGIPPSFTLSGPWEVSFPLPSGKRKDAVFDRLSTWSEHKDNDIRFFSGAADYRKRFEIPASYVQKGRRLMLDLGKVMVLAGVKLNGNDLGILWKPQFLVDVTAAAKEGENLLEIKVVNLWPNRLIGDEHLPADCEWESPTIVQTGTGLRRWPQWLLESKPSPTGRSTFATWRMYSKDSNLLPSGLLGPVTLRPLQLIEIE